jgi:hypothetical protein
MLMVSRLSLISWWLDQDGEECRISNLGADAGLDGGADAGLDADMAMRLSDGEARMNGNASSASVRDVLVTEGTSKKTIEEATSSY